MKPSTLIASLLLSAAIAIPAAISFAAATPAATGNNPAAAGAATSTATTQWLTIAQVHNQLEAAGYRNIEKIEREHGNYEVKATRDGQRVKLYVHPQTGAVLDMRTHKDKHEDSGFGWGWGRNNTGKPGVECSQRRCRDDLPAATGGRP